MATLNSKELKTRLLVAISFIGLLYACTSESERILKEKIDHEGFDFSQLKMGPDSLSTGINESIQYGFIHLQNGEQVKFWFLTHHATSDIGGTIYEYPNGDRQFCSGFHCCEVQFYDSGKLGKTFKNADALRAYVTETDGIRP